MYKLLTHNHGYFHETIFHLIINTSRDYLKKNVFFIDCISFPVFNCLK